MLPSEKLVFMRRVQAVKNHVDKLENGPSVAVKSLLSIWQKQRFPLLCRDMSTEARSFLLHTPFNDLASWLLERPFLESAFWLSSAYAIWVGNDTRSEKSLYFTPPVLAERLIDNLIAHGASLVDHVWLDPACGGGAFLAPVAVRMVRAMRDKNMSSQEIVSRVAANLLGNDIDETLAHLSRQFLLMALYEQSTICGSEPKIRISTGNGLVATVCDGDRADVIICNPPYRKMKAAEVKEYADRYADVIEGQPNIYGLFIQQCLRIRKPDAVVGLLTPTSYLSGKSFSKLRSSILVNATVAQLDLVDDRVGVFIGVSQGAVLSLYACKDSSANNRNATSVYGLSITGEFTTIGKCTLAQGKDAWSIPRRPGDQELIQQAASSPYRLSDFGYTARVGTYVDYRDERKTYTRQPNNKKMKAVFPLIWSSDITTEGKLIHGRTSKQDRHHIFIEMGSEDHVGVIRRPAIALQRVTSPDQPRRLVCAAIDDEFIKRHKGVVGENHVIFLEQTAEKPLFSAQQFAEVLASEPLDRLFRSISGAVNVSVSELNQLSLPNPVSLSEFIDRGYSIDEAVIKSFKKQTA